MNKLLVLFIVLSIVLYIMYYVLYYIMISIITKQSICGEGGVVQRSLQREKDSGDSGK